MGVGISATTAAHTTLTWVRVTQRWLVWNKACIPLTYINLLFLVPFLLAVVTATVCLMSKYYELIPSGRVCSNTDSGAKKGLQMSAREPSCT